MSGTSNNSFLQTQELDFQALKTNFINFLKGQSIFKGYDFTGANFNVLLDILSRHANLLGLNLNLVGSELFLEYAQLYDNAAARAKELNYLPGSYKCAQAIVTVNCAVTDTGVYSVVIPEGFIIVGTSNNYNYTFQLLEPYIAYANNYSVNCIFYEGYPVTEQFTATGDIYQKFILSNPNIDTDTLTITVQNSLTDTTNSVYTFTDTIIDVTSNSNVFYLQPAFKGKYAVYFGDGIFGKALNAGNIITAKYLVSSDSAPNGINAFSTDLTVGNNYNVSLLTLSAAGGGESAETIDSIKFNAPKAYQAQNRAITISDYESIVKSLGYQALGYGGEQIPNLPQYGKVYIAVNNYDPLYGFTPLTNSQKTHITNVLQSKSGLQITPVIVDPDFTWIQVISNVDYNINLTSASTNTIYNEVKQTLTDFNNNQLQNFNSIFRFSKLVAAIDNSDTSIVGNDTTIKLMKQQPIDDNVYTILTYNFYTPIDSTVKPAVSTASFQINGIECKITDDNNGNLNVYQFTNNATISVYQSNIGTVNYTSGQIQISNLYGQGFNGYLTVYITPTENDLQPVNNTKIYIDVANSQINVVGVTS